MSEEACKCCGKLSTPYKFIVWLGGHICEGCNIDIDYYGYEQVILNNICNRLEMLEIKENKND